MDHTFHFTASRYNATEVRSHFINDCCFGEDVIAALREGLVTFASEAEIGEPIQEDWGWGFWLEFGAERYWIYAGVIGEQDRGKKNYEWRVGIDYQERIFVWRRPNVAKIQERFDALVVALRTIITSDPGTSLISEEDD